MEIFPFKERELMGTEIGTVPFHKVTCGAERFPALFLCYK